MKQAKQAAAAAQPPPLWRFAEILQMRRMNIYNGSGENAWYFECQLCGGTSRNSAAHDIAHREYCPIERMKE